jgi:hypothetical protein
MRHIKIDGDAFLLGEYRRAFPHALFAEEI